MEMGKMEDSEGGEWSRIRQSIYNQLPKLLCVLGGLCFQYINGSQMLASVICYLTQ